MRSSSLDTHFTHSLSHTILHRQALLCIRCLLPVTSAMTLLGRVLDQRCYVFCEFPNAQTIIDFLSPHKCRPLAAADANLPDPDLVMEEEDLTHLEEQNEEDLAGYYESPIGPGRN